MVPITDSFFGENILAFVTLRNKNKKFIEEILKKNLIKKLGFFKTPKECFKKCQYYLNNNMKANKISKNGNIKITKVLKPSNDQLIRKIVNSVFC